MSSGRSFIEKRYLHSSGWCQSLELSSSRASEKLDIYVYVYVYGWVGVLYMRVPGFAILLCWHISLGTRRSASKCEFGRIEKIHSNVFSFPRQM